MHCYLFMSKLFLDKVRTAVVDKFVSIWFVQLLQTLIPIIMQIFFYFYHAMHYVT